jgi:YHS domain-containing protein
MKKIILILITGFALNTNIYAQDINPPSPTTEEEYNYVTKGYKVQTESGLDMKKGYEFGQILEETFGDYNFNVMCLIRVPKKEIAALLVKTKSANSGKTYYFCIPNDNEELNERYFQDLSGWDYAITKAYCYLMTTKLSEIIAISNEMEKNLKK